MAKKNTAAAKATAKAFYINSNGMDIDELRKLLLEAGHKYTNQTLYKWRREDGWDIEVERRKWNDTDRAGRLLAAADRQIREAAEKEVSEGKINAINNMLKEAYALKDKLLNTTDDKPIQDNSTPPTQETAALQTEEPTGSFVERLVALRDQHLRQAEIAPPGERKPIYDAIEAIDKTLLKRRDYTKLNIALLLNCIEQYCEKNNLKALEEFAAYAPKIVDELLSYAGGEDMV